MYGDISRGVIDWVEIIKDNGTDKIYLVYPHGRIAMGVEPPITSVRSLNFLYGVRRPASDFVILRRIPERFISSTLGHLKKIKLTNISIPGSYLIIEGVNNSIKLKLYTRWDYRYDIHCATQILGRWFLLDVQIVNIREDYFSGFARLPFFNFEVGSIKEKTYRLDTGEELEIQSSTEILGWTSDKPYIDFGRYWRNNSTKLDTLFRRLKREEERGKQHKALRTTAKIIANMRDLIEDYTARIAVKTGLAVGTVASLLREAAEYYPGLRPFIERS